MKTKLLISFSGGETSAYMAQWLWNNKRDEFDMIFVFANTDEENEATLQFVEKCSQLFGFPVVWVEAVPRVKLFGAIVEMCSQVFNLSWMGGRIGTTHKIVNFNTASRNGEPFEKVIQKFGIPNMATPHCTRELKQRPINSYAKSIGWKKYYTAIGIREDEIDRVNSKWEKNRFIYTLVFKEMRPMTKPKINFWWSQQPFRLELKGYQGNCKACWKKSDNKLYQIARENINNLSFPAKMDLRYSKYIPKTRLDKMNKRGTFPEFPVTFFRRNRTTEDIIKESKEWDGLIVDDAQNMDESCEVFSECYNN